jgi:hypothetical protein
VEPLDDLGRRCQSHRVEAGSDLCFDRAWSSEAPRQRAADRFVRFDEIVERG